MRMIQGIGSLVNSKTLADEMLGFGKCNRECTNEDRHASRD